MIHEDIVNDVKSKMQPKDDYIQLASLFKLFGDVYKRQIYRRTGGWGTDYLHHFHQTEDRGKAEPEMCGEEPEAGSGKVKEWQEYFGAAEPDWR